MSECVCDDFAKDYEEYFQESDISYLIDHKVHLSYKDILLVPYDYAPSEIMSRSDPDISSDLGRGVRLKNPIISSPMDTVTGVEMAVAMNQAGGLGIYTRHIADPREEEQQCIAVARIRELVGNGNVACAMGVKCDVKSRAEKLISNGANIICLDIANGNHVMMIEAIKKVRSLQDKHDICIVAGNVATPKAALRLAEAGANAIKIGIGSGAACLTRRVTGFGVPQLTAIINCAEVLKPRGIKIIADGGIRNSGDAVKAFWGGADAIMMGYALAGHTECPQVSEVAPGEAAIPRRTYRGMASRNVSGRYDVAAEGVCLSVQERGPVQSTITEYVAGIKSACSYANAMNLEELRNNVHAIRVSTMSQEESDPVGG